MHDKQKVIFLSGMAGSEADMNIAKKILHDFDLIYFPYDTKLSLPIVNYAQELDKFITNLDLDSNEKVNILAISAGGIIVSYYLRFISAQKIEKLVTICTPFKGTWLPVLFSKTRLGVWQLFYNSKIVKKIGAKPLQEVQELNIWCFLDPLVLLRSGKGSNNLHTFFFLHWFVHLWPPVLIKVKNFFLN